MLLVLQAKKMALLSLCLNFPSFFLSLALILQGMWRGNPSKRDVAMERLINRMNLKLFSPPTLSSLSFYNQSLWGTRAVQRLGFAI